MREEGITNFHPILLDHLLFCSVGSDERSGFRLSYFAATLLSYASSHLRSGLPLSVMSRLGGMDRRLAAAAAAGGHVRTRTLPLLLSLLLALLACSWLPSAQAMMRPDRVAELRRATVGMFYHGFDNYMHIAFPEDEVCEAFRRSRSLCNRKAN